MAEIDACMCRVSALVCAAQCVAHLDVAMENLVLARVALMHSASKLEENAPNLVLFHLLSRTFVLSDDSSEIAVFAKFHDDVNCG
jgi:hypothetical protein